MKKYSKRLFSSLIVTLLLGGNLISSVGAYAETVSTEPKTGETTGGESPTPPNGEKETSLPSLQDNLPKPVEPPVKEQPKVDSPNELPKAEEPKVDSKAEANPKEESAKETESEDDEELPQLSNQEAGDSPEAPDFEPLEPEEIYYEGDIGSSHIWISSTESEPTLTLHIGGGDFNDTTTNDGWTGTWGFPGEYEPSKVKIEGQLILAENAAGMFQHFGAKTFEGTHYLDTSHVRTMEAMFYDSHFEELDLSSFDTSHVTNMRMMFTDMPQLREVNVSSFDTTLVMRMDGMFAHTFSLDKLNLSSFNTDNVREFSGMFQGSHLATLDLSNFNLERKEATNIMDGMLNLTKVILGPNTRLNPESYWGAVSGMPLPGKWKNIDKPDLPLLSTDIIANDYNNHVSELSGTYVLIVDKPVISVHDSTIYMETPDGVRPSENWDPEDNFDFAYDSHGNSINPVGGIVASFSPSFHPDIPGKYQVNYTIRGTDVSATATITVKERKEVTVNITYQIHGDVTEDNPSGERQEKATIKTDWKKPINFMEPLGNPLTYRLQWVSMKIFESHPEHDPEYKFIEAEKALFYLPGWEDQQDITIDLYKNPDISIETNSLTLNLGQSNPEALKAGIKSINSRFDIHNAYVKVLAEDGHQLGLLEQYFNQPDITSDLKTDPNIKFDVSVDPAVFNSTVSTIGAKTLPVEVTIKSSKADGTETFIDEQTVNIPVTVQYGNALDLKGHGYHHVMYLGLDWEESPDLLSINPVLGDTTNPNAIIWGDVHYYSIGFLSGADGLGLNQAPDWNVDISGNLTSAQTVAAVGKHTFKKSDTNIIKVYHWQLQSYPNTFTVITNNAGVAAWDSISPRLGGNTIFFEMTESGYKTLGLNQLTPKNGQSIFKNASQDYLNAHVKDFIDIDRYPGLTVSWLEYPDTRTEGNNKPGKLLVTQKSSTGKDLTYEYPVNVNVVPGTTTLIVPDKVEFQDITIDGQEKIVSTKLPFELKLLDTHVDQQKIKYTITLSIKDPSESLAPYLLFRIEPANIFSYPILDGLAAFTNSYTRVTEEMGEPIEIYPFRSLDFSPSSYTELILRIPYNYPLKAKQYNATITWDIAEVP